MAQVSVTWDLMPWTLFLVLVAGIIIGAFAVWLWTRPEEPDPIPTGRWVENHARTRADGLRSLSIEFAGGAGTGNGRESRITPRPYDWQTDG